MTLFPVVSLGNRIEQTKRPLEASAVLLGGHRPFAHPEIKEWLGEVLSLACDTKQFLQGQRVSTSLTV